MNKMTVNIPGHEYDICMCSMDEVCSLIDSKYRRAYIITDKNVEKLYSQKLTSVLNKGEIKTHVVSVEPGEESKSMTVLESVYTQLLQGGICRKDLIIALGGGVIGDLAGFAAATLLRGIDFIQMPTTLLAQVDSSVGGKVAVNLREGKNLAGAFYEPKLVLIDTSLLKTLDDRQFNNGMAELIKHGAILDAQLFYELDSADGRDQLNMDDIIFKSVDIKRRVVEKDEKETGIRMFLNFGHTYGHAVEKYYGYKKYTHGEAVAIGMVQICDYSEKIGLTKKGTAHKIEKLLLKYGLPSRVDETRQDVKKEIFSLIKYDKKIDGDIVNLVILKEIGDCFIFQAKPEDFERMIFIE